MKFPFIEKAAKSFSKSASDQVKKEIKKTSIDLIPGLLTLGAMALGMFIFGKNGSKVSSAIAQIPKPYTSSTRITTNNYFLGNVSDEIIKKILEEQKQ